VGIDVILLYRKQRAFVKEVLNAIKYPKYISSRDSHGLTDPSISVRDGAC
jgi:hypothetical protein